MLELKKLQVQRMKVDCGKQEMELKILEREEDIARLKENIENQTRTIKELDEKIILLQGE